MSTKYLLPCSCGRTTPVELAQAGETIACACGAQMTAPTLRGLKQLPAVADTTPVNSPWTVAKGVMFLGGLLLLGGAAALAYFYATQPRLDLASVSRDLDAMSLSQTRGAWAMFERGLPGKFPDDYTPQTIAILSRASARAHMFQAGAIVTVLGLVISAFGVVLIQTSKARRKP